MDSKTDLEDLAQSHNLAVFDNFPSRFLAPHSGAGSQRRVDDAERIRKVEDVTAGAGL